MLSGVNDILKGKDIRKLKLNNGKTIEQALKYEADRLKGLIEKYIREYRKVFKPQRYRRTHKFEESVQVKSEVKVINGKLTALVYFDKNSTRRSGFGVWNNNDGRGKYDDPQGGEDDEVVNLVPLINEGYVTQKPSWFKDYQNFGFRGGNGFLDKAIMEFNATNSLGIVLDWRDIIQGDMSNW